MKEIKTALAARLLLNIPAAPRAKLLRDTDFNRKAGLEVGILRLAGKELEFARIRDLARKAAVEPQAVEGDTADGTKWGVRVREGNIEVFVSAGTDQSIATLPEIQLLLSGSDERLQKLHQIVADLGANGPVYDQWEGIVRERPLSDDELERMQHEFELSTYRFVRELSVKLNNSAPTADDVFPTSRAYFEGMCGRVSGLSVDPDAYLKDHLLQHRRELLRRDLVSGLFIVLPGSLRGDLYPGQLVVDFTPDVVWDAISKLSSLQDPFSLAGILDISLNWPDDVRFSTLAKDTLRKLCAESLQSPSGFDIYEGYALFAKFATAHMRRLEGGATLPPFWRRLCGFTHAAHLLHVFLPRKMNMDELETWVDQTLPPGDSVGQMADLRSEPLYWSIYVRKDQIRAEVLGQLFEVRARHLAAGRPFLDDQMLVDAVNTLPSSLGPRAYALPGPLQGHIRPFMTLPDEDSEQLTEAIDENHDKLWRAAAYIASIYTLPEPTIEKLAQMVAQYNASAPEESKYSWLLLAAVCAASSGSAVLAGAVSKRVVAEATSVANEQDVHELFLALLAASGVVGSRKWKEDFNSPLRGLAFHVPRQFCNAVWRHLQWLRYCIPAEEWYFARAEALAMAGAV